MTRFQIAALVAGLLGILALATRHFAHFGLILAAFMMLVGVGVALPRFRFFGPFICRGHGRERHVALTFDDGPDPSSTPALLDLLEKEQVKAAFFCIGRRVAVERELAARIAREGHLLGNHTYSHSNSTNFFPLARLQQELSQTQTVLQEATGIVPRCFRPPMGLSNSLVFQAARSLGLDVIGWTARGLDTQLTEPERVVKRIVNRLKPGAIILLHDGNIPEERLVSTVQLLLSQLRELNYRVVRLDQLLAKPAP